MKAPHVILLAMHARVPAAGAARIPGIDPERSEGRKRKEAILIILLLFAAVAACYGNILDAGFIWDDEFLIVRSPLVRAPLWSFQMFKQDVLNTSFTYSMYYRPVQILSYAVDYHLRGMNPFAFHFSNVFLHFLNSVLVFFLTRKLTGGTAAGLLASLLFAIHPAHAGAVSYISGRTDLLFFFFGFLYMFFHVLFAEKKKYPLLAASVIFLGFSLLSKEAAIVFPLLLLFMMVVVLRRRSMADLACHVPGFLLAGGYAALHYFLFAERYSRIIAFRELPAMFVKYLDMAGAFFSLLIFPVGLHMRRSTHLAGTEVFISAAAAVCAVFLIFHLRRNLKVLLFSLWFFLVALVPFVFVTGYFEVFAEHWVYLPGYGAFLFMSVAFVGIYSRKGALARYALAGLMFCAVIFYSTATVVQNKYWRSDMSLSDRVLKFSEQDDAARYYKMLSAREAGSIAQSLDNMDAYVKADPTDPEAWYLKGRWELAAGNIDEAERAFRKVLDIDRTHFNGYTGLALVAFARGEDHRGIEYLERVVRISPKHSEAFLILGTAYSRAGKNTKALEATKRAKKIDPYDYDSLVNLGTAYTRSGGLREGAVYYLEATRLYPEKPLAFYNLGYVFLIDGQKQEAEKWLRKAVMVDPEFEPALELLRKMRSEGGI